MVCIYKMNDLLKLSQPTAIQFPPNSNIYMGFIDGNLLLKHLKIPQIQREVTLDRVTELELKLTKEHEENGFYDFGILLICDYNDNLYLLNGQHRYCALKSIVNKKDINIPIRIEVRKTKTIEEMEKLWIVSNDSREVKLVKNSNEQLVINGLRKYLNTKYSNFISDASKPHKPNINLNNLVEEIESINFINKLGSLSLCEIIQEIENINNFYNEVSYNVDLWNKNGWGIPRVEESLEKCKKKCPVNTLYLGIFQNFEWLHRIIEHIEKNILYEKMPHCLISAKTRKIKKKVVLQTWEKWNSFKKINERGDSYSSCFVCKKQLEQENFQCGHIIPFFYGGENNMDNLQPICSSCNNDMNIENLYSYKNRMFPG